jgi:pyrroloquinoline quinone biosynthesis protein D
MTAPVRITEESVPRLPRHARLQFDQARQRWTLQVPERVLVPDDIAVAVLKRCDGVATVATIAEILAAEYAAPRDEVTRDIIEMLQDLADKNALVA